MGPGLELFGSAYGGFSLGSASGDWGSVTGGGRWGHLLGGGWRISATAEASAFTVTEPSVYRAVTGELRPEIAWSSGATTLFLDARAAAGRSEVETTSQTTVPGPVGGGGLVSQEVGTDLWYWGGGPGVRHRAGEVTLEGSLGAFGSALGDYATAEAAVAGETAGVGWRVDLKLWDTPGGTEASGGLRLEVPLGPGWDAHASGARTRPDPLLGSRPSFSGALLASRRVARIGAEAPGASVYRLVETGERALVRFRLERPGADRVTLVGDFTGWRPVEMERRDGQWVAEVRMPPGTYHFGFRVDGEWHVPEDAPGRVSDDWGRVNATLVVPAP